MAPQNSSLNYLSLKNNRIASVGSVRSLQSYQKLQVLNLQNNPVSQKDTQNELLKYVLDATKIKTLKSLRIRLSNDQIVSVQQKQVEEEPPEEMKIEPKNWVENMKLDIGDLDFDKEYAQELERLKKAIQDCKTESAELQK